jgi:hypothetical protein
MNNKMISDFVRVSRNASGSSYFLELGDHRWRAVEIQPTGRQVVARSDVNFRRAQRQVALSTPSRDGEFALLKKYVNVEDDDFPLLFGWITAALGPVGPHPIPVITDEQGAAKSTLARLPALYLARRSAHLRRCSRRGRRRDVTCTNV